MVMEWLTLSGSIHLAKYCADSSSECSLIDPGHFVTASGDPQSLVRCILYVFVLGVALVCKVGF